MSRGKYNPDGGRESGLAGRIRQIIRESGVKQVEFAQSLGISANYVYLLTSGRKTAISETLARLSSVSTATRRTGSSRGRRAGGGLCTAFRPRCSSG